MTGGIFISYRRDDTRQAAGRLADDLADQLGNERIFRDVEKIELGVDFEQALNQALVSCEVMLVLIGRQWSGISDAQGRRRLEQPSDWIRIEIVTALKRGIRVVPVLIDGAQLPAEDELPEDLRPLVRRQALEVADGRWKGDVARLAESLGRGSGAASPAPGGLAAPPVAPQRSNSMRNGVLIGASAVVALLLAYVFLSNDQVAGTWERAEPRQTFSIHQNSDDKLTVSVTEADGTSRQGEGRVKRDRVIFKMPAESDDQTEFECELEHTTYGKVLSGKCGGADVTLTRSS
jgi:hypothetical protein